MKLADWLKAENLTPEAFGVLLEEPTTDAARAMATKRVRRYCLPHGHNEGRIPRPETMAKIVALTSGAVTANDFYGIDAPAPAPDAEAA